MYIVFFADPGVFPTTSEDFVLLICTLHHTRVIELFNSDNTHIVHSDSVLFFFVPEE